MGCTVPLPLDRLVNIATARGMTSERMVEVVYEYEERALVFLARDSGKSQADIEKEVAAIMLRRRTGKPV